jgi:chemotaxis family two-component system response regulator Rcp1
MSVIHILLVEDNEGDVLLITEALSEVKMESKVEVVHDGESALEFLSKREKNSHNSLPDLILLDINLPKKNGHEVLGFIKAAEHLKEIPVIMLTTSSAESDISLSYENHANCYCIKPVEAEGYTNIINSIERFWLNKVELPDRL